MSLSATLFGRDSAIFRATNILGLGIPGWLDKTFGAADTEGPRLSDLSVQTSTYGADLARVYGTVALFGNVMWLENNKLKEKVKKNKSGGKGGASTDPTKTYSYSATFALGLCEGEIAGVRRIWCADKLIYSAGSSDVDTIIANNKAQSAFTLYRGTDDQMPDSRYEANVGVGNATAFRGIAYLVFQDFQLAEYSNTLQGSQFKVEVVKQATFQTLRTLNTYTLSPNLDESAAIVSMNENVISYSFDPSDLRPPYGDISKFVTQSVRTDGTVLTQSPDPIIGGKPTGADFVIPVGRVGTADAFYLWTLKNVESVVLQVGGTTIRTFTTYPADVSPTPGGFPYSLGVHVNSDGLHLFRCHDSASGNHGWYYEFLPDGEAVSTTRQLLKADGTPYTTSDTLRIISNGLPSDGCCPVVEVGGQNLWLLSAGGSELYLFKINSDGDFQFSETINLELPGNMTSGASANGILAVLRRDKISVITYQPTTNIEAQGLQSIISSEVALTGILSDADLDVSLLTASIRGYRIAGGTIRSALEPLRLVAPFDVIQSGYKIKFVPRGGASVATIPYNDLGATSSDQADSGLTQSREQDTQLPAKTSISYLDASREYGVAEASSERINTASVNKVEIELAVVLTADEAAKIAEIQTFGPIKERSNSDFSVGPEYLALEASDIVTVQGKYSTTEVRITDINYTEDGRLEIKSKSNQAALYTSNATGAEGQTPSDNIGLPGLSLLVPLDIPVIDETIQNAPGFVAAASGYSDGWPGALMVRSADGGQTWVDVQAFAGQGSIGTVTGTLPVSASTVIDQRSLSVRFIAGAPESVTLAQLIAGSNYAAYGKDGRWEIVRFQNAALQTDGSYLLSGFVRGDKGTEWTTGLHATLDYFVLLEDPDNAFVGMAVETIGLERLYRGITAGNTLDTGDTVAFTYRGVNLKPLSPVFVRAIRDGSSNLTATFIRRSRLSNNWWVLGVPGQVGEATEAYEIDVMSGTTVKRTITATSQAFSYSAADQTTDFGSPQASITFRIYQMSAVVGRGYPREVTL